MSNPTMKLKKSYEDRDVTDLTTSDDEVLSLPVLCHVQHNPIPIPSPSPKPNPNDCYKYDQVDIPVTQHDALYKSLSGFVYAIQPDGTSLSESIWEMNLGTGTESSSDFKPFNTALTSNCKTMTKTTVPITDIKLPATKEVIDLVSSSDQTFQALQYVNKAAVRNKEKKMRKNAVIVTAFEALAYSSIQFDAAAIKNFTTVCTYLLSWYTPDVDI